MNFINFFTSSVAIDVLLKLVIALILSSLIGIERELVHKPAGLKTHTLICLSATLIMALGIHMKNLFPDVTLDPARLPAQILAGIGFVGAGTIMREGLTVKGLTTAASLLSITCIGLCVGAGFFEGAIFATIFIFLILCFVSPVQNMILGEGKITIFTLISTKERGTLGKAQEIFDKNELDVLNVKQIKSNSTESLIIKFTVRCKETTKKEELIQELCKIDGVSEVNVSKTLIKNDQD
ncbi:MAG: MgtC/SapB family protein [Bacilli bacterium]|nr:MgtC/SapB family protein [Bacilli bacterium]